jgi:ATP-binding cassette subfamily B protein
MTHIPQLDETDCGAACLAMVARHHNSRHALTAIRDIAGTDRQGTNLAGLVKAGQALGFDTKALKGTPEALTAELLGPFIAHIAKPKGGGQVLLHFVVVAKITKKHLLILDPGEGKRRWSHDEFLKVWTGYVVFLTPNAEFKPIKETKGLFARFLPLLVPHTGTLVRVAIASLLLIVFGILGSLYFRYLIDEVLFSRAEFTLHVLSIGVVVLTLFQVLLGCGRGPSCHCHLVKTWPDTAPTASFPKVEPGGDLAVSRPTSWALSNLPLRIRMLPIQGAA